MSSRSGQNGTPELELWAHWRKPETSLLLLCGPSGRCGAFRGYRLGIEFAGEPNGRLTNIEQRAAALLHHGAGLLVEAVGEFPDRLHLAEQIIRLARRQAGYEVCLAHGPVDGRKSIVGLADDAFDGF